MSDPSNSALLNQLLASLAPANSSESRGSAAARPSLPSGERAALQASAFARAGVNQSEFGSHVHPRLQQLLLEQLAAQLPRQDLRQAEHMSLEASLLLQDPRSAQLAASLLAYNVSAATIARQQDALLLAHLAAERNALSLQHQLQDLQQQQHPSWLLRSLQQNAVPLNALRPYLMSRNLDASVLALAAAAEEPKTEEEVETATLLRLLLAQQEQTRQHANMQGTSLDANMLLSAVQASTSAAQKHSETAASMLGLRRQDPSNLVASLPLLQAVDASNVAAPVAATSHSSTMGTSRSDSKPPQRARQAAMKRRARQQGDSTNSEAFPEKLYRLLEEVEAAGKGDIVSFTFTGRAFKIHHPGLFVEEILPSYFRHRQLSSFKRQLGIYSFERIPRGPEEGAYFHPLFQRGRKDLCARISKMDNTGSKKTEWKPDFSVLQT